MDDDDIKIPIIKLDDTHILIGYQICLLKILDQGTWAIHTGGGFKYDLYEFKE